MDAISHALSVLIAMGIDVLIVLRRGVRLDRLPGLALQLRTQCAASA